MTRALSRGRTPEQTRPVETLRSDAAFDLVSVDTVTAAVDALTAGRAVVLVDPCLPEQPGYLLAAARLVQVPQVAFMVRHTSGVLCVPLAAADCDRLDLPQMVRHNENPAGTAFTVSVDAAVGGTTGISATDRTGTIRLLANPAATPEDFSRPGHVLPLRARPGGVLERPCHTEAAVDLARLAGAGEAGVFAAIVHDDATVFTVADAFRFADRHTLAVVTVPALVRYRQLHDLPCRGSS